MKKSLLLFIFILFSLELLLFPTIAGAQRPLEVIYPSIPGFPEPPSAVDVELPVYVKYIFTFLVVTSGLVALGVLIYAGFRYLTSAGNPQILQAAKDQMLAGVLGIIILLSSWIFLNTINPELIDLRVMPIRPLVPPLFAGVYLCLPAQDDWQGDEIQGAWDLIKRIKLISDSDPDDPEIEPLNNQLKELLKEISEWCWHVPGKNPEIPRKFNSVSNMWIWTVPTPATRTASSTIYGAILNDRSNFEGRAQVALKPIPDFQVPDLEKFNITTIRPSSVRPFVVEYFRPGSFLKLYALINFNKADPDAASYQISLSEIQRFKTLPPLGDYGFERVGSDNGEGTRIGSAEIEGKLIVVFFKDFFQSPTSEAMRNALLDVVTETNADLHTRAQVLRWCWFRTWWLGWDYFYCSDKIFIIGGGIY